MSGGPATIRPVIPGDAAAIRDCAGLAYARYVAALGRRPAPMTADFAIYPHLGYLETGRRREDGFERVHFERRLT